MTLPAPITSSTLPPGFVNSDSFYNDIWSPKINGFITWATALIAAPVFIAPTLASGWTNHGGGFYAVGYYKDAFGFVTLRGVVDNTSGSSKTAGTIFTLPAGYAPLAEETFAVPTSSSNGDRVDVTASGGVNNLSTIPSTGYVFLDGIRFYVGS